MPAPLLGSSCGYTCVHVQGDGGGGWFLSSFIFLSQVQKRSICKLSLLLSLANHSQEQPVKVSWVVALWFLPLQFSIWVLIRPPPSPRCPAGGHKGGLRVPFVRLCPASLRSCSRVRNRPAALRPFSQCSSGQRQPQGRQQDGKGQAGGLTADPSRELRMPRLLRLVFEAPAPPPRPSAPPAGEPAGNHTSGGRQSFQFSSQGCCCVFLVHKYIFFFHKGLGHQGYFKMGFSSFL